MSRARPITVDGEAIWFDQRRNNERASIKHLEALAMAEDISLDDLLDEGLSQGQVIFRLRVADNDHAIPAEVLERRRLRKLEASRQPQCRICTLAGNTCEGMITRHHFIPRWLMLTLENYQAYAARPKCTIPICLGRHRDLHFRGEDDPPKSIAQYLTEPERLFAQKMLTELKDEHPAIWALIEGGDAHTYEYQLVRDFNLGAFRRMQDAYVGEVQMDVDRVAVSGG